MHLTRHTDYSLRLLMLLAAEPERLHTIEEVAQRYRISRNHLMKVAQRLTQAGFVRGLRGRNGGLELAQRPEQTRLGDVVRATEEQMAIAECFDGQNNSCVVTRACRLRAVLHEATTAFMDTLNRYTLADLVESPQLVGRIRQLLAP